MKAMKLSSYFEYVRPEYIYLKLKPMKSIRNYNSDKIAKAMAIIYKNLFQTVKFHNWKLFFEAPMKVSYYIYMEKNDVSFYFIIPKVYEGLLRDKILDSWKGITIEKVDELPNFSINATRKKCVYSKEDAMSLATDKRSNTLLASILNTLNIIEEGEKVGIFYNFIPVNQRYWRKDYDGTIVKLNENHPIDFEKMSFWYCAKMMVTFIVDISNIVLDTGFALIGQNMKKETNIFRLTSALDEKPLCTATKQKRESIIIDTQILVLSESPNKSRQTNNALSACEAFKSITADNDLEGKKLKKGVTDFTKYKIDGVEKLRLCCEEAGNLLSLPARELLEEYHFISSTNTIETEVPKELQTGYISLGKSMCKGTETEAFLRDNYDQGNFPLVLIGEQGSGKTTFIKNYCRCAEKRNEGIILIDFIKGCELADSVRKIMPSDKIIEIDISQIKDAQGIGYNELKPNKKRGLLEVANLKAIYISSLINSINVDGEPLSTQMDRYLSAASNITMLDANASLRDVIRCLERPEVRHKYIDAIPNEYREILEDEIAALLELDERSGKGENAGEVIGTKFSKIEHIEHRVNLLKKDLKLKVMFNKSTENNINLVKAMEDGKIVLFKIPQSEFPSPYAKNILVTYLLTKIWSVAIARGDMHEQPKRMHIIVDEIFQAPTSMKLLNEEQIPPQTRKFGCKFVFSCQFLKQIGIINP
ncbi:MAG TPA: ATP-binding protein, partial [Candidatus Paceibacterota bacterium]